MKNKKTHRINVKTGDFPFPIIDGPVESRYLTWIRNNANYMAVRGFLDYVRAIGVLLRGIVINMVVLLPYALVVAFVIAAWYRFMGDFVLTTPVLIFAVSVVLLFPLLTPFFNIMQHRRRLETGSDSSVKPRSLVERVFGGILLAVVCVVAMESLVAFLGPFHIFVHESDLDWAKFLSMMATAVAIFSFTEKLLAVLAGLAKKLAILAIGLLGVLVPLFVILLVSDYLVFYPTSWPLIVASFVMPLMLLGMIILVVLIGLIFWVLSLFSSKSRVFNARDVLKTIVLLTVTLVSAFIFYIFLSDVDDRYSGIENDFYTTLTDIQEEGSFGKNRNHVTEDIQRLLVDAGKNPPPRLEALYERIQMLSPTEQQATIDRVGEDIKDPMLRLLKSKDMPALARALISAENQQIWYLIKDSGFVSTLSDTLFDDMPDNDLYVDIKEASKAIAAMAIYSQKDYPFLFDTKVAESVRGECFWANSILLLLIAIGLWVITRLTVDVNLTSIHGLYRDRLASAFLVGIDTHGDVDIEKDLDLGEICCHEAGSTAPYHLINVALNMQGSKMMGIRDRQCDFFVFSKKFIGGFRTGYCRSENMELVFPQMSLSTAMAISAAAAAPNMGRATSPALVVIMTLFNIRLGYWLPNPGRLEDWLKKQKGDGGKENGYTFDEVFSEELVEVARRWEQLPGDPKRYFSVTEENRGRPTPAHALVGIGFSGGGIRSATINLGIAQELHRNGVFDHIDYMSTVSGGGYLGSSISALMRQKTATQCEVSGQAHISQNDPGEKTVVSVSQSKKAWPFSGPSHKDEKPRKYEFTSYAKLAINQDERINKGQRLLNSNEPVDDRNRSFSTYYRWRVRPTALLREMAGMLNETHPWVNVSDGGHIENLAGIELLRRRCKYIIIGDGEADQEHNFNGLAILMQTARIDLGVQIEIKVDRLRLDDKGFSQAHWVLGRIHYPGEKEKGYLLYLKSSVTGDEDEVINRYRSTQPTFPHESTADQFFGEGQFEAYRSLGEHIGKSLFKDANTADNSEGDATPSDSNGEMSFADLEQWFKVLESKQNMEQSSGTKDDSQV